MPPLVGLAPYPNYFDPPKTKKRVKVHVRPARHRVPLAPLPAAMR